MSQVPFFEIAPSVSNSNSTLKKNSHFLKELYKFVNFTLGARR